MDTKKLELLLETAHIGSLKRAAEKLNYTQSGLIYTINTLEREVGVSLLDRGFKGVTLSTEGKYLEPFINDIVQASNRLEDALVQLTTEKSGELFVGVYPSIARHWLPSAIREFSHLHPTANIHICVGVEDISKWLESNVINLAIGERGIVGNNKWVFLQKNDVYVAVPCAWGIPEGEPLSLEQLVDRPVLLSAYNPRSEGNTRLVKWAREENTAKKLEIISPDSSVLLSLVGNGAGIAFMSSFYQHECPSTVHMHPLLPPIRRETGIILPNHPQTPLVKDFVSFIQDKVVRDGMQ